MIETKKSRRETQMAYIVVAFTLPITNDDNPTTFSEMVHNNENNQWKLVINEEMQSLYQNQNWELVELLKELRAISNK